MNSQNRYLFLQATSKDSKEIAEVFEQQSFEGNLAIQYLRSDDPLASFQEEGDEVVCLIVRDMMADNLLIGTGACVIRRGLVNCSPCNIGYLTGLKLREEYHKQFPYIAKAYLWIKEHTVGKVDYYYTTILADNIYVQKMLEKKRNNMPSYYYIGDYHTLILKAGGKRKQLRDLEVKNCDREEVMDFFEKKAVKLNFCVESPIQNHLENAVFYSISRNGTTLAIASLIDQRKAKQYKVRHYGSVYKLASYFPTNLLGYPAFPKVGEVVSISSMNIYLGMDISDAELRGFVRTVASEYKETQMIMIGVKKDHRLEKIMKSEKVIHYKSKMYQVEFGEGKEGLETEMDIDISFQ